LTPASERLLWAKGGHCKRNRRSEGKMPRWVAWAFAIKTQIIRACLLKLISNTSANRIDREITPSERNRYSVVEIKARSRGSLKPIVQVLHAKEQIVAPRRPFDAAAHGVSVLCFVQG
jgi:hypothetical protein